MNPTKYYSHVQQAPGDVICAYEDLPLSEKMLFSDNVLYPQGPFTGKYLTVGDNVYMCAYLGMHEVFAGHVLVAFRVNGKFLTVYLSDEEVFDLAFGDYDYDPEEDWDKAMDILDQCFCDDVTEYVNDWEIYERV